MLWLILSDVKNLRCKIFDDEDLSYQWESNKTITDYIKNIGDISNFRFNDSIRTDNGRIGHTFTDNIDRGKASVSAITHVSSFSNTFMQTYARRIYVNRNKGCIFKIESNDIMTLVYHGYLYKIRVVNGVFINSCMLSNNTSDIAIFLHGMGIDDKDNFVLDLRISDYLKGYNQYIASITFTPKGRIYSRKFKFSLTEKELGSSVDFNKVSRSIILRR